MDYKNTLNLPKTDFPMKADLPKREPALLEKWAKENIYENILKNRQSASKYILHDGPPYANGDIHIGHALNKTLKDIIIKFKTMRGFASAYVPGWDCHGLPVEHALFKELGITKYQIGQVEFRQKAYDYALKFVNKQKDQFIRLGIFADWQNPYLTLLPEYEEGIISSLEDLVSKGYIYRGLKPVNWCFKCETALAEAEVEYENHTSPSIFVKFALDENKVTQKDGFLLIWTTTPWTLMANVAVAVHPEFLYNYVRTEKGDLIIASDLLSKVLAQAGLEKYEVLKEFKGKDLEGLVYTHPFGLRKGRVVMADYVSREDGSGLVHTAPGHGMEDYATGLKNKLEIIMPVDSKGKFDSSAQEFAGQNIYDANKNILEKLSGLNALLWQGTIQHSYPHCWRCKKPVIFRATKQWFLKIDHNGLRNKLLEVIKKEVQWIPESGKERIGSMVESRPDWCLSRQRYWGVPIPALVCDKCKEETLDVQVIKKFAQLTQKEGSDSWFKRDVSDFIPVGLKCPHCGNSTFSKGADILDVWFDSGVSSQSVLKKRKELKFPAELYLEGSDQHRGWFQSSIIPAMCIDGVPPFKSVLTHGFVVDGDGRKMSKSTGNVISPQDIIKNSGADILRLWVASSDYNEDIRISPLILTRLSEAYRKIRNTARFILSNLYDFNPDTDKVKPENLRKIDKWIINRLEWQVIAKANEAYDKFEFHKAYQAIYDFCNTELSSLYLDMAKGRLYTFGAKSEKRRAAQTAMYDCLNVLLRVMAPILPFTAEEIWQSIPKENNEKLISSVHLLDWPEFNKTLAGADSQSGIALEFSLIFEIISDVTKALEEKRAAGEIGSSFDARINLLTNSQNRYKYLTALEGQLCEVFKVSQVEIVLSEKINAGLPKTQAYPDISIEILKAQGQKCQRCWNYSDFVGTHKEHPSICSNCQEAIS